MIMTLGKVFIDIKELMNGLAKSIEDGDEDVEQLYRDIIDRIQIVEKKERML